MTKAELVTFIRDYGKELGGKAPTIDQVDVCIDGLIEAVKKNVMVRGEELKISGFGKFTKKTRPARVCRNPNTGESVNVPENDYLAFTAYKM